MKTNFKKIILVRHGDNLSSDSIENNLLPLSEKGVLQSIKVSHIIENDFDIVFCSNSLRAMQTAKIISKQVIPIISTNLIEKGWGNENHDGTETEEEAKQRLIYFFYSIVKKYKGKRILIVSHGSLIKIMQDLLENNSIKRNRVYNCTIIEYDKNMKKRIINTME